MRQTKRIYQKGKRLIRSMGPPRDLNWNAILTTTGVMVFGLVVVLMHKKIYEMMMHSEAYQIRVQKLHAAHFPDWADGKVKESIQKDLSGPSISMYDPNLLVKVKQRYESSRWVRRVRTINRNGLTGVRVKLELRRPAAYITDREGRKYLIDRKGVRVPGVYNDIPDAFGSVYRIQAYATSTPESGEKWRSDRLQDAAYVAAVLQKTNLDRVLDVERIVLKGSARDWKQNEGRIILRTKNQKSVIWGGANKDDAPWEPSPRAKLKNLQTVLKGAPNLTGVKEVKLQFDDPIVSLK